MWRSAEDSILHVPGRVRILRNSHGRVKRDCGSNPKKQSSKDTGDTIRASHLPALPLFTSVVVKKIAAQITARKLQGKAFANAKLMKTQERGRPAARESREFREFRDQRSGFGDS
jgi:hypothetical protein